MKIGVFCSASDDLDPIYYEQTEALGQWIGKNGHSILYGGTAQGLMECIARSVKSAGGETIGVLPRFMYDNGLASPNADELILTADILERKNEMLRRADVFVALPGGFGTLDEVFHVIASGQVGAHEKKVFLFSVADFYAPIKQQMENAFSRRFTPVEYRSRFAVIDSLAALQSELRACAESNR